MADEKEDKPKGKGKKVEMTRLEDGERRTVEAPVDDVPNMLKNGWTQVDA